MRHNARLLLFVTVFLVAALRPAVSAADPTTTWTQFPLGPFPLGTPTTLAMGAGSSVDVTVTTGGTHGVNASDADTLGIANTGLQYSHLRYLAIFNGGGSGSVPTRLTFTNIHVGASHQRGLLMVGAINGLSSPVTVSSSIAGRVQTWTIVGRPFDFGASNSFPVSWDASSGTINTSASIGIDSRCIVLDLGHLTSDGDIVIQLSQHLNDGIIYSFGEEQSATAGVPWQGNGGALALVPPNPNPVHEAADFAFTLPSSMRARIGVFDVTGRLLARLADGDFAAGEHRVRWNLLRSDGSQAPAGMCFVRMDTAAGSRVERFVVVR